MKWCPMCRSVVGFLLRSSIYLVGLKTEQQEDPWCYIHPLSKVHLQSVSGLESDRMLENEPVDRVIPKDGENYADMSSLIGISLPSSVQNT